MKKSSLSLLVVAIVIAAIVIAGCGQNQTNQGSNQTVSTNPSTSSASPTASTSVASASPTVSPSPSASPTASTSLTPTPPPSGKIATSIDGNRFFNSDSTITQNSPVSNWGFVVVPKGSAHIPLSVPVTVKIDNIAIGQVRQVSDGTMSVAFSLTSAETNSLAVGGHTLTVSFAGDSTYQPSEHSFPITVK